MLSRRAALLALPLGACRAAVSRAPIVTEPLSIPGLGRSRTLRIHLPPSYAQQPTRRYPVLYLHDGQNLFDGADARSASWGVDRTLDALARASGFEAIAVGIDHGGALRIQEMLPHALPTERFAIAEGDAYADFAVTVVKPWVDARWRTLPGFEHSLVGGSSLGAVIAHHALQRHAGVYGKALLFSPAYWAAPSVVDHAHRQALPAGTRVALYAGTQEGDTMVPLAERMHALLQVQRTASRLDIVQGAPHDEAAWRAALEASLRWLYELDGMLQPPKKK